MPMTNNLGRNSGVPSLHGRIATNLFSLLLERIKVQLKGWKSKHLSFASKVVLAQFVLSAIPYFSMKTNLLPKGVCKDIDRVIRRIIWGCNSANSHGGVHLVRWEEITKPKMKRGLELRSME